MNDEGSGQDWSRVNALARKPTAEPTKSLPEALPLARLDERVHTIKVERLGVIGRFKSGAIERKAALAEIAAMTEAHLEATKHALKRALEVDKQRVDLIAQKYIYQITEEHLRDMREMGIHNFEARAETLLKLNSEVARIMKTAEVQDIPEFMRTKTLEGIISKYEQFFERIMSDEMKLP